ncbi:MAG: OmpA family protein [Campylobacterales bacterium]|nr:OmpA family protein [Campylobacterales bacterium]
MKHIRSLISFLLLAGYIATNSIAGNLLHGPTLEKTGVSSTEGAIVVYREDDGDTGSIPAIFIDDDIVGSLLPGEFSQAKLCADAIKLRVATRGGVVSAGQPQKIQIRKGKITYVKITKRANNTFMPLVVDEAEGEQALKHIKRTSNIINRFIAQVKFDTDSLFEFDSDTLMPSASGALDRLVQNIKACPNQIKHIQIIGHTDRIGNKAYNQKLSSKRAKAVADYLTKHGISLPMDVEGRGSSEPVTTHCRGKYSPKLIQCLRPDRRVVVKLLNEDHRY